MMNFDNSMPSLDRESDWLEPREAKTLSVAAAVVGGSVLSSVLSSGAASDAAGQQSAAAAAAAKTQADASKYATDAQIGMFNQQQAQTAPWRTAGQNAINALSYGFGLPQTAPVNTQTYNPGSVGSGTVGGMYGGSSGGNSGTSQPLTRDQIVAQLQASGQYGTPATVGGLGNFSGGGGGIDGGSGIGGAGDTGTSTGGYDMTALNAAADAQLAQQNQQLSQPAATAPTTDPTGGGLTSGQFNHQFNASDLATNLSPSYNFMLGQGLGALNNQNTVTGGLVSGNALKGINDYAQNYASNGYQQAYDNYNTNQNNIFNRLSTIAGLGTAGNSQSASSGANAANSIANTATTTAGNIGSAQLASGASQAAGTVGSANAISGGLNNISSMYQLNNLTGGKLFSASGTPISTQSIPSSGYYAANDLLTS